MQTQPEMNIFCPLSAAQNYGFIAPDSGGPDIFVHKRNVQRDEEGKPGPLYGGFKDGSAFCCGSKKGTPYKLDG